MVENPLARRKLNLYSKDGHFDTSVESTVISCFVHLINLNVSKKRGYKTLLQKQEASHFTVDAYQIILERESDLREYATLVGGAVPILRFIYSSEIVDYEWYP